MAPDGFLHIAEYLSPDQQSQLLAEIRAAIAAAPLYIPTMPRTGKPLSVQMTNCGPLGWVTDKVGGYRYQAHHPDTGRAWPPIPDMLKTIWADVAPTAPPPEACLINCYAADSRLGLHCDADEAEFTAPVVSLSLGDDAWFRIGGLKRRDPTTRIRLCSGDLVVLGGAARLAYHGIDRILPGTGSLLDAPGRINLTLRRVT